MKEVITLLLLIGGVFAFHFIYEAICNFFMKIDAEMPAIYESKEEDLEKIMSYHVMALPALVVDEKVVAKGVISEAEIKKALMQ